MQIIQLIQQEASTLPMDYQREVLDFINFLKVRLAQDDRTAGEDSPLFRQLEQTRFIGCIETDEQLSTTYKQQFDFSDKLGTKP